MKHALRKYISNCGSALFMVISTMAALILLVTAMYLSVLSQRSVQLSVFNSNQAYVTSTSISDMVVAYVNDKDKCDAELYKLFNDDTAGGLKAGEAISTNGNGFASLMGGTADDSHYGAYDVTITRLDDDKVSGKDVRIYDIAVTVSQNGVVETTHTQFSIAETEPPEMPNIQQFFTATGYLPNDVIIDSWDGGNSELFSDAEYTTMEQTIFTTGGVVTGTTSADIALLAQDITIAGTFELRTGNGNTGVRTEPRTWVVGNKLVMQNTINSILEIGESAAKKGKVYVGQDLIIRGGLAGFRYADVYVLGNLESKGLLQDGTVIVGGDVTLTGGQCTGDLYVGGDLNITAGMTFGNVYVNGDVYITTPGAYDTVQFGNLYVGGNLYIDSNVYTSGNVYVKKDMTVNYRESEEYSISAAMTWVDGNFTADYTQRDKYVFYGGTFKNLNRTFSAGYKQDWVDRIQPKAMMNDSQKSAYDLFVNGKPESSEGAGDGVPGGAAKVSSITTLLSDAKDYMNTAVGTSSFPKWEISASDFNTNKEYITFTDTSLTHVIKSDCEIADIDVDGVNGKRVTLIIDSGKAGDIRKIRVQANCKDDFEEHGLSTDVCDRYENVFQWAPGAGMDAFNHAVNVFIVGEGTVVIDVPEGVTYQATNQEYVGHLDWAVLGKLMTFTKGSDVVTYNAMLDAATLITPYIHNDCAACTYTKAKDETNKELDYYVCSVHKDAVIDEDTYKNYDAASDPCLCHGMVMKDKITAATKDSIATQFEAAEDLVQRAGLASYQYEDDTANVNLWVVSVAESADIQIGVSIKEDVTGTSCKVMDNKFFGYIYAPYMTYLAIGAGGNGIKVCGGVIVSDYVLNGSEGYYFIKPSKNLREIAGGISLNPSGSREWRVIGV